MCGATLGLESDDDGYCGLSLRCQEVGQHKIHSDTRLAQRIVDGKYVNVEVTLHWRDE